MPKVVASALVAAALALQGQTQVATEKIRRATELMRTGSYEQAIPLYLELAAEFPADPSFGINLAHAQYQTGRYRETIELCSTMLKRQNDIFALWLFLGGSYLSLDDAARAVEPLKKAIALQPNDRNARVMLAGALLVERRYADAVPQFETAARLMPDNPRIWYGLVQASDALATETFQRLDETAPHSAELPAVAGFVELDRNQYGRALRRFRQALAIRPAFPELHAAIAEIYDRTGHSDWAKLERAKESQIRPIETSHALYQRWKTLREHSAEASARLDQLPDSAERHEASALRSEREEQYADAARSWKEALAFSPGDAEIRRGLANALCEINDCAAALPILSELLEHAPNSAELNYRYGKALISTQQADLAMRYFERAIQLDGKLALAHGALGQAYLEAGKLELAIPQLEAALARDEDGSRHYQLARAYQAAGKQDQAATKLREYREIVRRLQNDDADDPGITPPESRR